MSRFGANIFVELEAESIEKARELLGKIVEANFGEEVKLVKLCLL